MITVCMATYNGENYIEEQLECIYQQTCQPDEVIICDDDSRDRTREIVEEFIRQRGLGGEWKLAWNKERKGYPENFYYCMSLAKGDVVFLADQDDVWDVHKIEIMCKTLNANPEVKLLACKMGLIDEKGKEIKTFIKPNYSKETERLSKISMEQVLYKNQWSGMVLAYCNKWYFEKREKVQRTKLPHDLALAILAGSEKEMFQIDKTLAWHRRHQNNAAGEEHRINRLLKKETKIKDIEKYNCYLKTVLEENILEDREAEESLRNKSLQMEKRKILLQEGKCLPVLQNYIENRRDIRIFSFLCDFLICLKER